VRSHSFWYHHCSSPIHYHRLMGFSPPRLDAAGCGALSEPKKNLGFPEAAARRRASPADRDALLRAAASGNPKFFFGSDSAPHPAASKRGAIFSPPRLDAAGCGALSEPKKNLGFPEAAARRRAFFGSDSAPHPAASKRGGEKIAAGVFTQPYTTQVVVFLRQQRGEGHLGRLGS
jgi:hypothetical protein